MYPTPGTMPDFGVIDESDIEWGEAGLLFYCLYSKDRVLRRYFFKR